MRELTSDEIKGIEREMLKDIAEFCEANGMDYFIMAGTLLGSVRHRGFIPWDDDIDVEMPRESYERFLAEYRPKGKYRIISCSTDARYGYPYAKVIATDTVVREPRRSNLAIGVYVDIFPIDCYRSERVVRRLYRGMVFLRKLCDWGWRRDFRCLMRERHYRALLFWPLSNQYLVNRYAWLADRLAKWWGARDGRIWVAMTAPYRRYSPPDLFAREDLFPLRREGTFEGGRYRIPNDPHRVLTQLYGDYRQLPPPEQRRGHCLRAYAAE